MSARKEINQDEVASPSWEMKWHLQRRHGSETSAGWRGGRAACVAGAELVRGEGWAKGEQAQSRSALCPGGRTSAGNASDTLTVSVSTFSIAGRWTMDCFLAEWKVLRSSVVLGAVGEVL